MQHDVYPVDGGLAGQSAFFLDAVALADAARGWIDRREQLNRTPLPS